MAKNISMYYKYKDLVEAINREVCQFLFMSYQTTSLF